MLSSRATTCIHKTTIQMYIIYKGRERKGAPLRVVGLWEKEEAKWEGEMKLVLAC